MKNLKLSYLVLALALIAFGCDEPNSDTLFSASFVELEAAGTASGSKTYTYLRENDGVNKPSGFRVNLASRPLDNDVVVNFVIESTSTAIANVHYTAGVTEVLIPAGSNVAELPIDIIADGIEAGEQFTIDITITSASGGPEVMTGLDAGTHIIQISCPSDLAGSYDYVSTATNGSPSFWNGEGVVTLTSLSGTTYTLNDFADGAFGDPQEMNIQDICGSITEGEPATDLADIVTGSVDGLTGVITLNFELTCCGGNLGDTWTYVMTPQ